MNTISNDSIIQTIREIAHMAAEDYMLCDTPMDETITAAWYSGNIENAEILKRICEQANQNVYLSKFQDPSVDKSNIEFTLANFENIIATIKESEQSMKDYSCPPPATRAIFEIVSRQPVEDEGTIKLSHMRSAAEFDATLRHFKSRMEAIKTAEVKCAEESFETMSRDALDIVHRGESIGDLAKLAAQTVEDIDGGMEKVAAVYDTICSNIEKSNFRVNTEFTKLSSMRADKNSTLLKPAQTFVLSIEKIAAIDEMIENIDCYRNKLKEYLV